MRLFPGVHRGPGWHLIKSVFLIALVLVTLTYYGSLRTDEQKHKTILTTNNVVLDKSQVSMLSTSMRKLLSVKSAVVDNSPVGMGGTDEDGNSNICHRAPQFRGDQCAFVQQNCPNPLGGSYINYLNVRYCYFQKAPAVFFILAFLFVLFLFYMLSDTAEANFCPSLTEISRYLKLSPNIAGVTFLALGNGAPDIASIIAGVLSGSTGFGVGEPIGAGLFVTTSVMAAVVLFSEVTVDGAPFLRDVITYLISIGFVFGIYLSGQIELWQSLMCLAIYLAYVSTVVIGRLVFVYFIQPRQAKAIVSDEDSEEHAEWYSLDDKRRQSLYVGSRYFPKLGLMYSDQEKPLRRAPIAINAPTPQDEETPRDMGTMVIEDHFSPIDNEESKIISDEEEEEDDYTGFWGKFRQRRDMLLDWIEWDEKSLFQKIFYFIEWPTVLARNLTIPIADPQDWSKFFAVVSPPFIGPFILFSLQKLDTNVGNSPFPLWALLAIIGVAVSIVILITSSRRQPPIYHFVFVFATFGISILWIMIIANELVGLLQAMGVMFKISDGILAMTVLAWGNSLGDLVADVIISRQGFPSMAVGAVYSGPCFNLLIGLGLSITTHCVTKGTAFVVEKTATITMSFIFLLASMISGTLIITVCRFRAPKPFGVLLLGLYVAFMIMSILIEAELIFVTV